MFADTLPNTTDPAMESLQRLAELVFLLGSEEEGRSRVGGQPRTFARTQILLHAVTVFNRQGLEETSVQDLLNAATISRRTFYKYFNSKTDVLESIYALSVQVMLTRFESELPLAKSCNELLTRLLHIFFDYQFSVGPIAGIMMEESRRLSSPLEPHRQRFLERLVQVLQHECLRLEISVPNYWRLMGLLWALEGAYMHLLKRPYPSADDVDACRRGMLLLWQQGIKA
jgi:AcrR family transcriptional regulator